MPFSEALITAEFKQFSASKQIGIYFAKYKQQLTAAAIIIFWQGRAYYHHGASLRQFTNLPTSYLLQWKIIQAAKARGCPSYNLWGVAEQDSKLAKQHRFAGISLFKQGFGGQRSEYIKTQDLPLSWRYWLGLAV